MVEEQCQQGCKWFQCFFPMAELAMFCKLMVLVTKVVDPSLLIHIYIRLMTNMGCCAGNSLVCRWQQHHQHDPEELTGITDQVEGQAEITVMNMMVTEEAEGTDPTSNHRENKQVE